MFGVVVRLAGDNHWRLCVKKGVIVYGSTRGV